MTLDLCADEQKRMVPLATAIPADYLPLRQIQQSTLWAARQGLETLDYAFPGKSFRRQIAQRMATLGVPVAPDDVLATSGARKPSFWRCGRSPNPGILWRWSHRHFPGFSRRWRWWAFG